jgi:hypothetical protein
VSEATRLPRFIIGGAMKSGTTTLHQMLATLPNVFIPRHEIYFFSIDDIEQHPEFFHDRHGRWQVRDWEAQQDEYGPWYASFFAGAPAGAVIGEDSTSYLHSRLAPPRIAKMLPGVRMIFLLRDPAARTYSHYWHLVRSGRATDTFERTLRHSPGTLFQRSDYLDSLRRFHEVMPAEQIQVILFEDLLARRDEVFRAALQHIGLQAPDGPAPEIHSNPARVPRSLWLQLWKNRLFRDRSRVRFEGHLPGTRTPGNLVDRASAGRMAQLNLRADRRPPAMRPETHRFLDELFARDRAALEELLGRELGSAWYRTLAS